MNIKGIGPKYRQKLSSVMSATKSIITPDLLVKTLDVSTQEAGRLLSRWQQGGWVKRLKKGIYIPVALDDITGGELAYIAPWVLAQALYAPGYIAGLSAVKHWDFSEQIFEATTFFTTKVIANRQPIISNMRFQLKTVRKSKIFGTTSIWRDNVKVLVSDPSKTMADILSDPKIAGGMRIAHDIFTEYQRSNYYNLGELVQYTERLKNKTIFKRLGFLLEIIGLENEIKKHHLLDQLSSGWSTFDPTVKNTVYISKWKIKIPPAWQKNDTKTS